MRNAKSFRFNKYGDNIEETVAAAMAWHGKEFDTFGSLKRACELHPAGKKVKRRHDTNTATKYDKEKTRPFTSKITGGKVTMRNWAGLVEHIEKGTQTVKSASTRVQYRTVLHDGSGYKYDYVHFSLAKLGGYNATGVERAVAAANQWQHEWLDEKGCIRKGAPTGKAALAAFLNKPAAEGAHGASVAKRTAR